MTDSELKYKVSELLQQGRKLDAIKFIKETLRLSLIESKDLAESIEDELKSSGRFRPQRSSVAVGNFPSLIFLFFLVMGIIFIVAAGYFFWRDHQNTNNSTSVAGMVVRLNYQGRATAPVVEYTWNGTKRIYSGDVFSTPSAFEVGEAVEMLVNRDDPFNVVINQLTERFLLVFVFGFIGLVSAFIGGIGVKLSRS